MASSVKISQLAAVNAATNDDVFIINDAGTNTRKITYENLTRNLIATSGATQEINGDLTINGTLTVEELDIKLPVITIDADANAVGINTETPQETLDVNGSIRIRNSKELRFGDYDNTNYVSFRSPEVLAMDYEYIMPGAYPTSDGQVLSSTVGGEWSWVSALTDPTTTAGDLVYRDILNRVERLPAGDVGQVLTVRGDGVPGWLNFPGSFPDPMTSPGDLIFRNFSNVTTRLSAGGVGQALIIQGNGLPSWQDISAQAGGDNTEVQFNSNGSLNGNPAFSWDNGSNILTSENVTVSDTLLVEGSSTFEGPSTFENTLTAQALFTARGNVSLGTNSSNTLSVNGLVNTSFLPVGGQNIGSASNRWGDLFMGRSLNFSDSGNEGILTFDSLAGYLFYGQGTGSEPARIRIYSEESNSGVTIRSPIESAYSAGSYTLTLPTEQAQAGTNSILINDGTGQLSFSAGSPFDLDDVTDNGAITPNTIDVGGLIVNGQTFPDPGDPDQVLTTDGAGNLTWTYIDADFY